MCQRSGIFIIWAVLLCLVSMLEPYLFAMLDLRMEVKETAGTCDAMQDSSPPAVRLLCANSAQVWYISKTDIML